jgi:hypothetical protein
MALLEREISQANYLATMVNENRLKDRSVAFLCSIGLLKWFSHHTMALYFKKEVRNALSVS